MTPQIQNFLSLLDDAFAAEIKRVSTLEYNSNDICRTFYENLRKRLGPMLHITQREPTVKPNDEVVEALAKQIYRSWPQTAGYPWVPNGNSDQQYVARNQARKQLGLDNQFIDHLKKASEQVAGWPSWKINPEKSASEVAAEQGESPQTPLSEYKPGQWWLEVLEDFWGSATPKHTPEDVRRAAKTALGFANAVFAERENPSMPVINVRFYIESGNLAGHQVAKIKRIDREDDGSITVTLDEWMEDPARLKLDRKDAHYYRLLRLKPQTGDYPWVVKVQSEHGVPTVVPCFGNELDDRLEKMSKELQSPTTEKAK